MELPCTVILKPLDHLEYPYMKEAEVFWVDSEEKLWAHIRMYSQAHNIGEENITLLVVEDVTTHRIENITRIVATS